MRITNGIISANALRALQANLQGLDEARARASSGLRLQTASDDPVAAAQVMTASGSLRAIEQYRRNIQGAQARLDTEEGALDSLTTLLSRAKQLALAQGNASADAQSRLTARAEVDQLLQQAVSLGNTRFGGAYLFGGAHPDVEPFAATAPFASGATPPSGGQPVEVAHGQLLAPTHDGKQVFLDTGVFTALDALSKALGAGDQGAIADSISGLDTAFDGIQAALGETGARANQLAMTSSNLEALDANLKAFRSDLSEVDAESAITDLVSRQTAYQAALLAASRVAGMSLTDYLR